MRCATVDNTACLVSRCKAASGKCLPTPINGNGPCDADGNACTPADVCEDGKCVADANVCSCGGNADCKVKEDGDLCNGTLFCDKSAVPFVCKVNKATVPACDAGKDTECAVNTCRPKTGACKPEPRYQGSQCDADGNPCTKTDHCAFGSCVAGANICPCQLDADCAKKDDGKPCNGTLYCDKSGKSPVCRPNLASVVTCKPTGALCKQRICDEKDGKCKLAPARQGHICDDGKGCTTLDACHLGDCVGEQLSCDDGDACTKDHCDGAKQKCVHLPIDVSATCGDGKPCTADTCDKNAGCLHVLVPNGAICGDGDACHEPSRCKAGACAAGPIKGCDDGKPCTADSCVAGKCRFEPAKDGTACGDGDACTAAPACDAGVCLPGKATACDDGNPCTADGCDDQKGCIASPGPDGVYCDDADPCTVDDRCDGGACKPGPARGCDDANPCTADSCDSNAATAKACVHKAKVDGAACGDGNKCKPRACDQGKCVAAKAAECKPAHDCQVAYCLPDKGCVREDKGDGAGCSDGDACTAGDACTKGNCKAKGPLGCDDGNPCTKDGCDKVKGCTKVAHADGYGCDDGDACTLADNCTATVCGGTKRDCDDGNVCTDDSCDKKAGCVNAPNKAGCDDGDKCTSADGCDAGKCAGKAKVCDDGDKCTADSCDAKTGQCGSAARSCDDGNSCTDDKCNPATGQCKGFANTNTCDDGDYCTLGDQCEATVCAPGAERVCDDGNARTRDTCDTKAKKCVFLQHDDPCEDGDLCTVGDACTAGKCAGKPKSCTDGDVCTADKCDAKTGACAFPDAPNGTACANGRACHMGICRWAIAVEVGLQHACALKADGTVACWGSNFYGQCGDGSEGSNDLIKQPKVVPGLKDVVEISLGGRRTCVRTKKNDLLCWGMNRNGSEVLGIKGALVIVKPTSPDGVPKALALDMSDRNLCWVAPDGVPACVGDNTGYKLGYVGSGATAVPQKMFGLKPFRSIHVGEGVVCATDALGSVTCVGRQLYGAMGNGLTTPTQVATPDSAPAFGSAVQGSLGERVSCFMRRTGRIYCAGYVSAGRLGNGLTKSSVAVSLPGNVAWERPFARLGRGDDATQCAIDDKHRVLCWGDSYWGEAGDGKKYGSVAWATVMPGWTDALDVASSSDFTCMVNRLGEVHCLGRNSSAQLGRGTSSTVEFKSAIVKGSDGLAGQNCKLQPGKCDDGNACTDDTCNLGTGGCAHTPAVDGTACGAGLRCAAGACKVPWASKVEAGGDFTCVRHETGKVSCWGGNGSGQLGDGNGGPGKTSAGPVSASGLVAQTVTAGTRHGCALQADGTPLCWGANGAGQAIPGGGATVSKPTKLTGPGKLVAVSAGHDFTCGVDTAGAAWCWGRNNEAQLGQGHDNAVSAAVKVQAVAGAIGISAGTRHACAVAASGKAWCWGDNIYGQIGNGKSFEQGVAPVAVAGLKDAAAIAAGERHTCVRDKIGLVRCWGGGTAGELGNNATKDSKLGVYAKGLTAVRELSAAGRTTCARTADGDIFCWGAGDKGQLGDGNGKMSAIPVDVGPDQKARSVGVGAAHACITVADGGVRCWGANGSSQLGRVGADSKLPVVLAASAPSTDLCVKNKVDCGDSDPCTADVCDPLTGKCGHPPAATGTACGGGRVCVSGPCRAAPTRWISAGGSSVCAGWADGSLRCWGAGTDGQLGGGDSKSAAAPGVIAKGLYDVKSIDVGARRTYAVLPDGFGRAWGDGKEANILGTGAGTSATPARISAVGRIRAFAAGDHHVCALGADTDVRCWGDAKPLEALGPFAKGALTDGVTVPTVGGATAITAGRSHTCVIAAGRVRCWGAGAAGQLGNGVSKSSAAPVTVVGADGASMLAAAADTTCAVVSGGVRCWGAGDKGQLGDGQGKSSASAVAVKGLEGAAGVAVGDTHACAWNKVGKAWCWGAGDKGQLGVSGVTAAKAPILVAGLPAVSELAAGAAFNCARTPAGDVHCWGANGAGQGGSKEPGKPAFIATPTLVAATANGPDLCKSKGCDDGKPCTLDHCNAFTGSCEHTPAPDRHGCGGDKACFSGVCTWAIDIAPANTFTCAVLGSGRVACWGRNKAWVLGGASESDRYDKPKVMPNIAHAVSIEGGDTAACALLDDGSVKCWGEDASNCRLGRGGTTPPYASVPAPVAAIDDAVWLGMSKVHACVRRKGGEYWCWGSGSAGKMALPGYITGRCVAIKSGYPKDPFRLDLGGNNAFTIDKAGVLALVGSNNTWQLGYEQKCCNGSNSSTFKTIANINVKDFAMGDYAGCAVKLDGTGACWGKMYNGLRFGDGSDASATPVPVGGIADAVKVAVGYNRGCFIIKDGTLRCFGENNKGQMGDGTLTRSNTAVAVKNLKGVVQVELNGSTTCARTNDGKSWCWGTNAYGEAGIGTLTPTVREPTVVLGSD